MKLSNKSEYAVRAVSYLAKNYNNGVCHLSDISKAEAVPVKFLEQIMYALKAAGIVESKRGTRGGYLLVKEAKSITVGDVVKAIEGSLAPFSCLDNPNHNCTKKDYCEIKNLWADLKESILKVLNEKTFADLQKDSYNYQGCYI